MYHEERQLLKAALMGIGILALANMGLRVVVDT